MFKCDLSRYFRQVPVCPLDYSLLGWRWRNRLYFDTMMPMGLRMAAYVCQQVTNVIKYIHNQVGYFSINYLDDFGSAEYANMAFQSFDALGSLFKALGMKEVTDKAVSPTTCMVFLGTQLDSIKMTLSVPPEKLVEINEELNRWKNKVYYNRRELESLISKLQFAANCIRTSRIFLSRLIQGLTGSTRTDMKVISQQMKADIQWWSCCMRSHNGISPMWLGDITDPNIIIQTDTCLSGIGDVCNGEYFHASIINTEAERCTNIAQLEIIGLLVAVRLWGHWLQNKYVLLKSDNQSVVSCINTGRASDPIMLDCMRAMAFECAMNNCFIKTRFIYGKLNEIPDLLSQWYQDGSARRKFKQLNAKHKLRRCSVNKSLLKFSPIW